MLDNVWQLLKHHKRKNRSKIIQYSIITAGTHFKWHSGLHIWLVIWRSWVWAPSKAPRCFNEQETLPHNQTKINW